MTYSLVARDPDSGCLGVAVQSHFFGVGAIVTWAEAGVGAIATQSFAEVSYGPLGLELMRDGVPADAALERLVAADSTPESRQVGMVDAAGVAAAHTGSGCVGAAGQRVKDGLAVQANMMERDTVWDAMVEAFESAGPALDDRLLAALNAAEAEGGDIRGRQSAAILIVGPERLERPWEGVLLNVRVDDHPDPLVELARLVTFQKAYERLGRALFQPGGVIGDYTLDDSQLEHALSDLEEAQGTLGPNPEPTFWRGVLLARAGRDDDAREAFRAAAERNPALAEFAHRLPAAGLLDPQILKGQP